MPVSANPDSIYSQTLNQEEVAHYSRHLSLPDFGTERQLRLKASKILLIGAGGLGCPAGMYMAAAGVGTIGVIDFDRVERSNLQRQIAHSVDKIGQPKVDSLVSAMRALNPLPTYHAYDERLNPDNIEALLPRYDLVLDGSDNFSTRYMVADACHLLGVPLLQGAVYGYEAQVALFLSDQGPCYRCVFEKPPLQNALASCAEVGILGVIPGTAGLFMATEAVKFLTGLSGSISASAKEPGYLLIYHGLNQSLRKLALARNQACPLCGAEAVIKTITETPLHCKASKLERAENQSDDWLITLEEFQQKCQSGLNSEDMPVLVDVRESFEFMAAHLPEAIHLPLGSLAAEAKLLLPEKMSREIVVYCQKGQRSLEAVRILRALGYLNVYSLVGGMGHISG